MRFYDFDKAFNPFDEKMYFSHNEYIITKKRRYLSFIELSNIIKSDLVENLEIAYELPQHLILIETKDKHLINIIKRTRNLNTYILKVRDTYQCIFKKDSDLKSLQEYTTNTLTKASIYVRTERNKPFIVLPYKAKSNESHILKNISSEYHHNVNDIDDIPFELKPIINRSFINYAYKYPIESDTEKHFSTILSKIKNIVPSYDDIVKIINAINVLYCEEPLTEEELEEFLNGDDIIYKSFMANGAILYDSIAHHFINKYHIKYNTGDNFIYYYDNINNVYVHDNMKIASLIGSLIPQLKTPQIEEVIETIKRVTYMQRVEFNQAEFNVLFKNGLFDLITGKFKSPITPNFLETNLIGANFIKSNSIKPNKFVDDFFATLTIHDKQVEQLIYEAIGYSLFRSSRYQVAFMCYGGGQNGKSTLFDLIKKVAGVKNTTNVSFKDLSNNFRPSLLENKLVSIAPDISSSNSEDSDYMKSVISGDDITIEKKNKDAYVKPVYATMWFGANKLPRTSDNSHGFYRRFIVIPMKADLSGVKRGEGKIFYDNLMTQENIDYVANKAIRAFFRVYHKTNEFTIPTVVEKEIEYYKDYSDTVRQFIKTKLEQRSYTIATLDKIDLQREYDMYKNFCISRGNQPKSFGNFEISFDSFVEDQKRKTTTS